MLERDFAYRAFLSYRATDAHQAECLHRQLEAYVVPRSLVGAHGDTGIAPRRLGRIFRDRDEARTSEHIDGVIAEALERSQQLIVLCTPNAVAPGSWVPREIELFRKLRPGGAIHAVIGSGVPPHCFPEGLLSMAADGRIEAPLAADLRPLKHGGADGESKGLVRLVAGLLGVRFDELWRRDERRRRMRRVTRTLEAAAVAGVAAAFVGLGNSYRTHARVQLELGSVLDTVSVGVVASEESPPENRSVRFLDQPVHSRVVARWIPASDVILRVTGTYDDGAERALSWHLKLAPGFSPTVKHITLTAPSKEEILAHPGMALVPAAIWIHGREREARTNPRPFWIDIAPPTVEEYLPRAEQLLARGLLEHEHSSLLTARQRYRAVDAIGPGNLRSLSRDLGNVVGVISQAASPHVTAPGDIAIGLGPLPCDRCPAPMTLREAQVYCTSRGMRLPTALEWELAVRGVDGRVYPWGDRFDAEMANVPGLPAKGDAPPSLTPVDTYRTQRSPFGLIDTVGNAGDWVQNDVSSYERVYMGATYRFNPEDATAFRMLPITDSDYLFREITARCVHAPWVESEEGGEDPIPRSPRPAPREPGPEPASR